MNVKEFSLDYLQKLKLLLDQIDLDSIESIVESIKQTVKNKSRIYVIGNGGSSAIASHMVNDLGTGLRRRDVINFDITSLADNTPVGTAIANDIGYENIFYMQLKGLMKRDDVIIAISSSGNSPNIIKAVEYARKVGATVIGCTGFDGGKLKTLSDISFHIETTKGEYGLVEDIHTILDHILHSYLLSTKKANL
jgi:D-sedoheptulose 7-phosphate isomerase